MIKPDVSVAGRGACECDGPLPRPDQPARRVLGFGALAGSNGVASKMSSRCVSWSICAAHRPAKDRRRTSR